MKAVPRPTAEAVPRSGWDRRVGKEGGGGWVGDQAAAMECLTPHRVAVALLARAYAGGRAGEHALGEADRAALGAMLVAEMRAPDGVYEPALSELLTGARACVSRAAGDAVAAALLEELRAIDSPDALVVLAADVKALLAEPGEVASEWVGTDHADRGSEAGRGSVDGASVLGELLRGFALSFAVMSFEATCRLLGAVQKYVGSALPGGGQALTHVDTVGDEGCPGAGSWTSPAAATAAQQPDERDDFASPTGAADSDSDVSMQLESDDDDEELNAGENESPQGIVRLPSAGACASPLPEVGGAVDGLGVTSLLAIQRQARTVAQVESYLLRHGAELHAGDGAQGVEAFLSSLAEAVPAVAQTHYLRYTNFLKQRDFPSAIGALHKYFDYTAGQRAASTDEVVGAMGIFADTLSMPDASGAAGNGRGGVGAGAGGGGVGGLGRWQSALLTLGSTHAIFGHTGEALRALDECVRLAQAHCDDVCLTHALAAVCGLLSDARVAAAGGEGERDASGAVERARALSSLQARCRRRAYELGMPAVAAFAEMSLARAFLSQGAAAPLPHKAASIGSDTGELLPRGQAPLLTWQLLHSAAAASSAADEGGAAADGGALCATSFVVRSEAWEHYASAPLAEVCAKAALEVHGTVADQEDVDAAWAQLSLRREKAGGASTFDAMACSAAGAGEGDTRREKSARQEWVKRKLESERCLAIGDARGAITAASQLAALAARDGGHEVAAVAGEARCAALLASGALTAACEAGALLYAQAYSANAQPACARALLLLCAVHAASGAPIVALPYALSAISLARLLHMDSLEAEASVSAAELYLALGKATKGHRLALPLLRAMAPRCAAHCGALLSARCQLALARAQLCAWGRRRLVRSGDEALAPALHAEEGYVQSGCLKGAMEASHLAAVIANALGRTEERNRASERFHDYQQRVDGTHTLACDASLERA